MINEKEYVVHYFQMIQQKCWANFVSTGYMGEVVKREGGKIEIKNTCAVLEVPGQTREGSLVINIQYSTHSRITNGLWRINEEDVFGDRAVEPDDEFMTGYLDSLEAFRLSKLDIQKVNSLPPNPRSFHPQGRTNPRTPQGRV